MTKPLREKVILIFGGSSGIGKATAKLVLQDGAIVYIIGRDIEKLEKAKKEIISEGILADPLNLKIGSCDLMNEISVKTFFMQFKEKEINHIIMTAGPSNDCKSILGHEGLAMLRQQFDMKFFAQVAAVSYGAHLMSKGGSVVFTSGSSSKRPGKGSTALAVCNGALNSIVLGLANDLSPYIRVNAVSPGLTDTEIWNDLPADVKQGMLVGFANKVPLARFGNAKDIGHAIKYLLENEYTTGVVLDCDGGEHIRP